MTLYDDVLPGLERLAARYRLIAVSNGNAGGASRRPRPLLRGLGVGAAARRREARPVDLPRGLRGRRRGAERGAAPGRRPRRRCLRRARRRPASGLDLPDGRRARERGAPRGPRTASPTCCRWPTRSAPDGRKKAGTRPAFEFVERFAYCCCGGVPPSFGFCTGAPPACGFWKPPRPIGGCGTALRAPPFWKPPRPGKPDVPGIGGWATCCAFSTCGDCWICPGSGCETAGVKVPVSAAAGRGQLQRECRRAAARAELGAAFAHRQQRGVAIDDRAHAPGVRGLLVEREDGEAGAGRAVRLGDDAHQLEAFALRDAPARRPPSARRPRRTAAPSARWMHLPAAPARRAARGAWRRRP